MNGVIEFVVRSSVVIACGLLLSALLAATGAPLT